MARTSIVTAIAIAVGVAALPSGATERGWQPYHNARFGYSVDVPTAYLFAQPAPDNGDGLSFASGDARVFLTAWGANNALAWSLDGFYEAALARNDLGVITYQRKADTWYVLSGYRTIDGSAGPYEAIFYERLRMAASGGAISGISLVFAPSLKDEMDPIVTRISRSLTPPR